MDKEDSALDEELARSLFKDVPIERILTNVAEEEILNKITKKFLANNSPLSFICACTCEGLLARSHFYSSTLLHALVCIDKLQPFRLAYGHNINRLIELFENSDLANEPLYRVKGISNDSLNFISGEEYALQATEKILNTYAGMPEVTAVRLTFLETL